MMIDLDTPNGLANTLKMNFILKFASSSVNQYIYLEICFLLQCNIVCRKLLQWISCSQVPQCVKVGQKLHKMPLLETAVG